MAGPMAPTPADQLEPGAPTSDSATDPMMTEPPAGKVLFTVMDNGDGSFTLQDGDEPESVEGGEIVEGEPSGESFDDPGALLKAILGKIETAMSGEEGSADENFDAGFTGKDAGAPMKKPMSPAEKF